jgi:hypothetical protein
MFEVSMITYSRILGSSLYRTYASVGRVDDTLHVSVELSVSTWSSKTKGAILRVLGDGFPIHWALSSMTAKRHKLKFR